MDRGRALIQAASMNDVATVRLFLEDQSLDVASITQALKNAIGLGYIDIVDLLLKDERTDPTAMDNEPITHAIRQGRTEIVKLLLEDKRADPKARDNGPIEIAIQRGHTEIVDLLLKDGRADPKAHQNDPIRSAIQRGHTEIVDLLLKDGRADPSTHRNYPIGLAAVSNQPEIMKLLIRLDPSRGVNIDDETVVNFLFANPPLLEHISEPIFMGTNWRIYINTPARTRLLLKHRYLLFKAWWETGNNLQLLTPDIREIITQYAQDMEGTLNSLPILPELLKGMKGYGKSKKILVTYRK